MKIILNLKFLFYLLASYFGLLLVINLNLLDHYSEDIFDKGFSFDYIASFIYHISIKNSVISFQFGVLMASIFSSKYFANKSKLNFVRVFLTNLPITITIAIAYFCFINWQLPKSNLETQSMLYEMKSTSPGDTLKTVDRELFSSNYRMVPISKINKLTDTLNIQINAIQSDIESHLIQLPDSLGKEVHKRLSLKNSGVLFSHNVESFDLSEKESNRIIAIITGRHNELENLMKEVNKVSEEKYNRILQPIKLVLLFIIGLSCGYIYSNQKSFLLFVLGTTILSVFYYGEYSGLESLLINLISDSPNDFVSSIIVLSAVTSIFFTLGILKEKNAT